MYKKVDETGRRIRKPLEIPCDLKVHTATKNSLASLGYDANIAMQSGSTFLSTTNGVCSGDPRR